MSARTHHYYSILKKSKPLEQSVAHITAGHFPAILPDSLRAFYLPALYLSGLAAFSLTVPYIPAAPFSCKRPCMLISQIPFASSPTKRQ